MESTIKNKRAKELPEILLSNLSEFIALHMGLNFTRERWLDLERRIHSAFREFGFKDAESCIQWLLSSPLKQKEIEILASHLTVSETYFFRDKKIFEILEHKILPELILSREKSEKILRIWVSGCSTGEEAYSIAIILNKIIPDLNDWGITILATDINTNSLRKGSEGIYSKWSFRDNPWWIKERYFRKIREDRYEILPHIKKMVTFSYHNLALDPYPSLLNNTNAMDIIFCRNVLMYFAPEITKKVIHNFYRSLIDKGWFIVSPSETSHILYSQFTTINFPNAILYKKDLSFISDQQKVKHFTPAEILNPAPELKPLPSSTLNSIQQELKKPEKEKEETLPDLYTEALTLYENGNYGETIEKLLESLSHNQDNPKVTVLLARAYANQGNLSEALKWSERTIELDKLNPSTYYLQATIFQEQGAIDEAIKSLKRSLYLDPNFVLANFSLANLSLLQDRFNESDKYFENALSLLTSYKSDDILTESEGMTAGRLREIINIYRGHRKYS